MMAECIGELESFLVYPIYSTHSPKACLSDSDLKKYNQPINPNQHKKIN